MPVVFNPFTGNLDLIDNTAAAGSDTQVQFNDGGVLGGDSGLVFNKTTNALTGGAFIPTSSTVPTNGVYLPGANQLALSTNGTGRLFVDAGGRVIAGVNSTADVNDGAGTSFTPSLFATTTSGTAGIGAFVSDGTNNRRVSLFIDQTNAIWGLSAKWSSGQPDFAIRSGATERLRIDSAGRLLVGTSSARVTRLGTTSITPLVQTLDSGAGGFLVYNNVASPNPATIYAAKSRGNDYTSAVQSGDNLFKISAAGADGTQATEAAAITIAVDGTPGTNDMPGRLVFSTTPDGSATPVERMRIKSSGIINFSNAPVYADNTAALAGGLVAGDVYRKSDGTLMITY